MELSVGKISNYTGQFKAKVDEKTKEEKIDDHMVNVDRDIQNLWRVVNASLKLIGSQVSELKSNADLGFSYVPLINPNPLTTPTNYVAHSAFAFCNSNSNLYIFNTSDNNFKTVHLS